MHVTVEDVHFIFGPNMNNISKDEDFDPANSHYDMQSPVNNLVKMFKKCQ